LHTFGSLLLALQVQGDGTPLAGSGEVVNLIAETTPINQAVLALLLLSLCARAGPGGGAAAGFVAVGAADVRADATAQGGADGNYLGGGTRGADALAVVVATAADFVDASASAVGGYGDFKGDAVARVSAAGATLRADASAASRGGIIDDVGAHVSVEGSGSVELEAQALGGTSPALARSSGATGAGGTSIGIALPTAADVQDALIGNPNAAAALSDPILGMAIFGGTDDGNLSKLAGDTVFRFEGSALDPEATVGLALVNLSVFGDFESLIFSVSNRNDVLIEETFTDAAAALAYFADQVLELGTLTPGEFNGSNVLRIAWEFDSGQGLGGFSATALLGVIPEPSTGVLCLQGLIWILVLRRRRRA